MRDLMEPTSLNKTQNVFDDVISFAINARLVQEVADKVVQVHPEVPADSLKSMVSFRRLMATRAFNDVDSSESIFYRFTAWYLQQGTEVFKYRDSSDLANLKELPFPNVTQPSVLGWRFWASFLGVGLLHDSFLMPNTAVRIWDAVSTEPLGSGQRLDMDEFMTWLVRRCPEFDSAVDQPNKAIGLGVSNGLRTLHDTGLLELRDISDAQTGWSLFPIQTHALPYQATELEVKDAEYAI